VQASGRVAGSSVRSTAQQSPPLGRSEAWKSEQFCRDAAHGGDPAPAGPDTERMAMPERIASGTTTMADRRKVRLERQAATGHFMVETSWELRSHELMGSRAGFPGEGGQGRIDPEGNDHGGTEEEKVRIRKAGKEGKQERKGRERERGRGRGGTTEARSIRRVSLSTRDAVSRR
jgi:hypothetical protein